MQAKNITAKQFAEEIGIQPSGMSHILSGRNNPSLDFVNKVLRRFPEIDANWLVLGKGEMYMSSPGAKPPVSPIAPLPVEPPTLFADTPEETHEAEAEEHLDELTEESPMKVAEDGIRYAPTYIASAPTPAKDSSREVVRMLLIYSDNTFTEYTPR